MSRIQSRVDIQLNNRENGVAIRGKNPLQPHGVVERRRPLGDLGNKQSSELIVKKSVAITSNDNVVTKTNLLAKTLSSTAVAKRNAEAKKKGIEKAHTIDVVDTRISAEELRELEKIDQSPDPQLVSEYINDIYSYMRKLETKYKIERDFLTEHRSTPKMRQILVNWLVEVHQNFKMYLETLHVTIGILDRFLQAHKEVGRETLQLVGTTALFIAGKYEEIYTPELQDFVYICDNTFTKKQIIQMELEIIKTLEFEFGRPLSIQFLRRFNRVSQVSQEHHSLGKYLLELSLLNYELCYLPPSLLAAAACCLSNSILEGASTPSQGWTKPLAHFSQYRFEDIKAVVVKMACMLGNAEVSKQQVIRKKYSTSKFDKISLHSKLKGSLVRKLTAQSTTLNIK